jgi:cbb3-type cytochrome oxidase maturation protein
MEVVFVLIPLSIVLVLLAIRAFTWSIDHGQFDDLERESLRILMDRDEPADPDAEGDRPEEGPPRNPREERS